MSGSRADWIATVSRALAADGSLPLHALARERGHETSGIDASNARPAGVVVPLTFDPEPRASFVVRSDQLREHAGEVGFPGGKVEPSDDGSLGAALREMEEEVGVARDHVKVLGALGPVPVISGRYVIHPFVVALDEGSTLKGSSPEVGRIVEAPLLDWVRGIRTIYGVRAVWRTVDAIAPHFELDGAILYGASAYVFYELVERVAAAIGVTLAPPVLQTEFPWGDRYTR